MNERQRKKPLPLEEEAKKFTEKKNKLSPPKPMTARRYLAGCALAGLLSRSHSYRLAELKQEAYRIADYMLDDD